MDAPLQYAKKNQQRFIDQLCEYLHFPSVSAQPAHRQDLQNCAVWIHDHCRNLGLDSQLCPTPGNPILIAKTPGRKPGRRPHYLVYGHYDVQPAEPFDLWKTPPFKPTRIGRSLFARGSSDNKGQHFAHLKAVESCLATGTELPCDLTFVIEGEEEVGSKNMAGFLKKNRAALQCDGIVVSDSGIPSLKHPALTYGLRGVVALEIELQGPSRDLHSGIYGGSVENPAMALAHLLSRLRDSRGRITVPGFYDPVTPLTACERKQLAKAPYNETAYRKLLGAPQLFGEQGYTPIEQRSSRPTIEINGLTSGYQGEGSKTIVPAWARAKITCRLVPNQTPATVLKLIRNHLKKICPPSVRMKITNGHGGDPYLVSPTSSNARAALRALEKAFGHPAILIREGGSIPIVNDFKKQLKADTLLLGMGLPDDNLHSPNEKFSLDAFAKGIDLGIHLWRELAAAAD